MNKKHIIFLFIAIIAICIITSIISLRKPKYKEVSYSQFLDYVNTNAIDTIYYSKDDTQMTFTLLNEDTQNMSIEERRKYRYKEHEYRITTYPNYDNFQKEMLSKGINIVNKTKNKYPLLVNMLKVLPLCVVLIFTVKTFNNKGNLNSTDVIKQSNTKFSNIIGQDEIMDDVKFITELIKNPYKGKDIGVKPPKGILLSGPPGTGKTLIAKAIAGEANVPFLYMNASNFIELYAGVGAKRVRSLFQKAKQYSPCIIFIDEIDSIGCSRDNCNNPNSEDIQTLNALLQEMDGFNERENVFVIAATNRLDKLDEALTRAGRFDRQIEINPPKNWEIRKKIFEYYLKSLKTTKDINLEYISKQISGATGADIAAICNEAGIIALMNNKNNIDTNCLEEAIDKKIFKGNRTKINAYTIDKEIIAYHEAGHAVMTYFLNKPISRVSIVNTTSGVGGFVMQSDKESMFMTKKELEEQILIAYAGRVSEQIKFGDVTTGAANDITQATSIMVNYIEKYGFDESFGLLDMQILNKNMTVSEETLTKRLSVMSQKMYEKSHDILLDNYNKVEILANKLMEAETLNDIEIKDILENKN